MKNIISSKSSYNYLERSISDIILVSLCFFLNPFVAVLIAGLIAGLKNSKVSIDVLIIVISIFIGLLNTTKILESDIVSYYDNFFSAEYNSLLEFINVRSKEYLYYTYTYFFYNLSGGSWKLYILSTTAISYYLILKSNLIVINKVFKNYNYKVLLLVNIALLYPLFTLSAHLLRNFIAASFILYFVVNYYFNYKNKWIYLIAAILTHGSSILFTILYILPNNFTFHYFRNHQYLASSVFSCSLKLHSYFRLHSFR